MTNLKEVKTVKETTQTVFTSLKKVISLIGEKHYFRAIGELLHSGKLVYTNHLKGKYITIKNRKIPLTLIIIVGVLGLYVMTPADKTAVNSDLKPQKQEINSFDNGKLRIYDMRKADNSVKGMLENYSDQNIKHVEVVLTFHDDTGETVYQGGIETDDMPARSRLQILVPLDTEFSYFRLADVKVEE